MSDSTGTIPGVEITPFGVTPGELEMLAEGASGAPPAHALFRLTIAPGHGLPDKYSYQSLLIDVHKGRLAVSADGGTARVSMGLGAPIRSTPRGKPFCDRAGCPLPEGQPALLGKGNGFSLDGGTLHLKAIGRSPAVITLTVVLREIDFHNPLCWICPVVTK